MFGKWVEFFNNVQSSTNQNIDSKLLTRFLHHLASPNYNSDIYRHGQPRHTKTLFIHPYVGVVHKTTV